MDSRAPVGAQATRTAALRAADAARHAERLRRRKLAIANAAQHPRPVRLRADTADTNDDDDDDDNDAPCWHPIDSYCVLS